MEDSPSVFYMGVNSNGRCVAPGIEPGLPHPFGGLHAHHVRGRQIGPTLGGGDRVESLSLAEKFSRSVEHPGQFWIGTYAFRGGGVKLGLVYAAIPRLARYSRGLSEPTRQSRRGRHQQVAKAGLLL